MKSEKTHKSEKLEKGVLKSMKTIMEVREDFMARFAREL